MCRFLAISLAALLAVAAVATLAMVPVAPADALVIAGSTLAMAAPVNAGISDEAQHLLNSLEAHFAAVKAAVAGGTERLVQHVEDAWKDVLEAIEGVEFSDGTKSGAQPEAAGAKSTTAASASTTSA